MYNDLRYDCLNGILINTKIIDHTIFKILHKPFERNQFIYKKKLIANLTQLVIENENTKFYIKLNLKNQTIGQNHFYLNIIFKNSVQNVQWYTKTASSSCHNPRFSTNIKN